MRGTSGAVPAVALEQSTSVPVAASTGDVDVTRQGAAEVCGREYFTKVRQISGFA